MGLLDRLYERVNKEDIIKTVNGVNGLVAVTKTNLYIVRGGFLEKQAIKSYSIKSISSIQTRKPNLITNGHFQIITSGNIDNTNRYSTAFSYAKDDNTVMIRNNFEEFLELENLIYKFRDSHDDSREIQNNKSDPIDLLQKLSTLRNQGVITEEEFENKKTELLSKI